MKRRDKRELVARVATALLIVCPISIGVIACILTYTLFGWEARAGALAAIGAAFTLAFGIMSIGIWDSFKDSGYYDHRKGDSFLRNWITEPEEKEPKKSKPREGAWKEE